MPSRILFVLLLSIVVTGKSIGDDNWPQFRGPGGLGIGSGNPPTRWDLQTGENVAWKSRIPGLGHSAPIIWGDHVFITTAVNSETESPSVETGWTGGAGESAKDSGKWTWQVISLHLETGKIRWVQDACEGTPAIKRHLKASHANCTPATDGQYVIAFLAPKDCTATTLKAIRSGSMISVNWPQVHTTLRPWNGGFPVPQSFTTDASLCSAIV